ncbi:MAG TPA: GGDEF domain-containing protein [Rhodospirillaceae bacterium]|nr:GGDEF domain-containing protein [Rhodospirillaceae bacterium]HAT35695.1 GGDEF domain-containing protein [Rhodospirillaceae bacterium]
MSFTDDIPKAAKHSNAACAQMERHGIPSTPENYTVWYAYVSEWNLDLRRELDAIIENNESFSPDKNFEIYQKYFGVEAQGAAMQKASAQIQANVDQVMNVIAEASGEAENYGNVLQSQAGGIDENTGSEEMKRFVETMMRETSAMVEQNKVLQNQLEQSSAEIEDLRSDLETVQHEALTDGLTEIANRKKFDLAMQETSIAAKDNGQPLCLFMTDINHFKKFNDTYGHQTGDQVLRLVAAILRKTITGDGLPARYGGEEFGVILPNTQLDDAVAVAEQVRATVAAKRMRKKQSGDDLGNITVSIGVALYRPGEALTEFIKRADDGLYYAKNAGRNQVVPETKLSKAAE